MQPLAPSSSRRWRWDDWLLPLFGMRWVGQHSGLPWSRSPEVLKRLVDQPQLRRDLGVQVRQR